MSAQRTLAALLIFFLSISSACLDCDRDRNRVAYELARQAQSSSPDWVNRSATLISVLNKNWYSSDLWQWVDPKGNTISVWHDFNTLEALIDYSNYSSDPTFDQIIHNVAGNFILLIEAQANGNDDAAWAGIALLKAYRKTHSQFYMTAAKDVFEQLVLYWDTTCNGGVWWNLKRTYKNAITNEQFIMLAVDLYEELGSARYLEWANRAYNWFMASGMLNDQNLINDGLTGSCRNNGGTTWTYNQGVILGGLAGLARVNPQNASMYLNLADKIARAVIAHLTMQSPDGRAILKEPTVHSDDGKQFKGIFMRYLGQLLVTTTDPSAKATYARFILDNADYVWNNARNAQSEVPAIWIGQRHNPPWIDAIAQSSAVDLMNAAILAARV